MAGNPDTHRSSPENESKPQRYNARLILIGLAGLIVLMLSIFMMVFGGDREQVFTKRPAQQENVSGAAQPPGVEEGDAVRFDTSAFRPRAGLNPAVTAALRRGQGQASQNPYRSGFGASGRRSRQRMASAQRQRAQEEQKRIERLRASLASGGAIEVPPPTFGNQRLGEDPGSPLYGNRPNRTPRGSALGGRRAGRPFRTPPGDYPPPGSPQQAASERSLGNRQEPSDNERFLAGVRRQGSQPNEITHVQGPLPPFTLPRGTIIPIALESRVSSDLPGVIIARVTSDVLDRSGEHVLVPAGSEVLFGYNEPSAVGQDRLLVAATRLTLPDGRFVNFQNARAAGPAGTAGMEGDVDRHLLSRFGAVGALAILGTAVNLSSGFGPYRLPGARRDSSGPDVVIYPPGYGGGYGQGSARAAVGRSFASQINKIIGEMLERQIDRDPTIEIPPGSVGRLILGQDLNMDRPYYENGSDFDRMRYEREAYRERLRETGTAEERGRRAAEALMRMRSWPTEK